MKNLLFKLSTLLFIVFTPKVSFSSHMMGGQITLKPVQGLTYLLTYTAYRDINGIQISQVANLEIINYPSTVQFTKYIAYDSANVILIPGGSEQYTYADTVTFPFPGNWHISYEECCRNGALLNITPNCHYFYADVKIDSVNATPEFLSIPIVLAQVGIPFYYNPVPYDMNGDSIAWELEIPLDCNGVPSGNYSLPSSDSLFPFTLDSLTGEITFLPNLTGNFQASTRVKEYRNGQLIGSISRDMQFVVEPSINIPVSLILNSNIPPSGNKIFQVSPGTTISISVNVYDPDNQNLSVTVVGEPFLLPINPAQTVISNGQGMAGFTFTWTPDSSQARQAPYIVGYRVSETYGSSIYQNDVTIALRIGASTTELQEINDVSQSVIYPNPASGIADVQFRTPEGGNSEIELFNNAGMLIFRKPIVLNSGGYQIVRMDLNQYPAGSYMVNISFNGKTICKNKLLINR